MTINSEIRLLGAHLFTQPAPAFTKLLVAGLGKVGNFELNMAERLGDLPAD